MKSVFVIIESDLRYTFFKRMHKGFEKLEYKPIYVTICPVVHFMAQKAGYESYLVCKETGNVKRAFSQAKFLETEMHEVSDSGAKQLADLVWSNLEYAYQKYKPSLMFIYNGTTIFTVTAGRFAAEKNIATSFFELANLQRKMFVDPKGTNGYSLLYTNPDILDELPHRSQAFAEWKEQYIKTQKTVKQKYFGKSSIGDFFLYTINKLYFIYLLPSMIDKKTYLKKYVRKFCNWFIKKGKKVKTADINYPYVFLPLQVSEDSQILLHSDIDNIEAIKRAHKEASRLGCRLVVKAHPAERNMQHIQKVMDLKKQYDFEMTMKDTAELIKNAQKVITINSTVALESILMEKDVEILGRSFYSHFVSSKERLAKYIMEYLVNIEYFSYEEIAPESIEKCIIRAREYH